MARPQRRGFDYMKFDTNSFNDADFSEIRFGFGPNGVMCFLALKADIFKDRGFYLLFKGNSYRRYAREYFNGKNKLLDDFINFCTKNELFVKELYETHNVLTSESIQSEFAEMCIVSRRRQSDGQTYGAVIEPIEFDYIVSQDLYEVSSVRKGDKPALVPDPEIYTLNLNNEMIDKLLKEKSAITPVIEEKIRNNPGYYIETKQKKTKGIKKEVKEKSSKVNPKIKKLTDDLIPLFPDSITKKMTADDIEDWYAVIEKLNRIDNYSLPDIETTIRYARKKEFFAKNFRSIKKLRKPKRDEEGHYFDWYYDSLKIDLNKEKNITHGQTKKSKLEIQLEELRAVQEKGYSGK